MSLYELSDPNLLEELSYSELFQEMFDRLIELDDSYADISESDPIYKVLEVAAYFRLLDRQRVNEAALATMLMKAEGDDLDQVAARYNVERLVITEADDTTTPVTDAVYEDDDDFRDRILLVFDTMSTAGSVSSYKYHALSASSNVADVSVSMQSAGVVLVTVLSNESDDGTASDELLETVDTALSADDVRPLTDEVVVQSADIVEFGGTATLYIEDGPEVEPILSDAETALEVLIEELFSLGQNVRVAAIQAALMVSGVQNVVLDGIEDILISDEEVASCTGITIEYGGVDE